MILYTKKHQIPFAIDDDDWELVSHYNWWISGHGYPTTTAARHLVHLHLLVLGKAPMGLEWDHIDRDKLNNRRCNLRAVTRVVNKRNVKSQSNNTSGVPGVAWHKDSKNWEAGIVVEGKNIYLGRFLIFEEAVRARQEGEKIYWGDER